MRIERHIFGSHDGYRTLAQSAGISASDAKALEGFAFGTAYDPEVRASFARKPAYWSRPLGPNRRALTRVSVGEPDDAGRPTMLFVTAVLFARDWDEILEGDARALWENPAIWNPTASQPLAPLDIDVAAPRPLSLEGTSAQRVMGLISLIEQSQSSRRAAIVREDNFQLPDLFTAERLLPRSMRRDFGCVYRGLACDVPVQLIGLARGAASSSANPIQAIPHHHSTYAAFLASQGLAEGRVPSAAARDAHNFHHQTHAPRSDAGIDNMNTSTRTTSIEALDPPARPVPAALMATLAAIALLAGGGIGWALPHPAPPVVLPPDRSTEVAYWQQLADAAIHAPLAAGPEQVTALKSVIHLAGQPSAASLSTPTRLVLENKLKSSEMAEKIGKQISRTKSSDTAGLQQIQTMLAELRKLDEASAWVYQGWLDDRSRGPDRLKTVVSQLESSGNELKRKVKPGKSIDAETQAQIVETTSAARVVVTAFPSEAGLKALLPALEALLADAAPTHDTKSQTIPSEAELTRQNAAAEAIKSAMAIATKNPKDDARRAELTESVKQAGGKVKVLPGFELVGELLHTLADWLPIPAAAPAPQNDSEIVQALNEFTAKVESWRAAMADNHVPPEERVRARAAVAAARKELLKKVEELNKLTNR